MSSQRSTHSLTVTCPDFGSDQRPSRILDSWSRPHPSAAALVSNPDLLCSIPSGAMNFTRHGAWPRPRFSAYAMHSPHLPRQNPSVRPAPRSMAVCDDRPPGSGTHDLFDVIVAKAQVLADECARYRSRGGLCLQPGLANLQNRCRFGCGMELTRHPSFHFISHECQAKEHFVFAALWSADLFAVARCIHRERRARSCGTCQS